MRLVLDICAARRQFDTAAAACPAVGASEEHGERFDHVCMGGTFDPLHRGHRALILRALSIGEHVFIGVTSGELSRRNREREVPSAEARIEAVDRLLKEKGLEDRAEVAPIDDPYGRALEPRFEAIVVSPETKPTAAKINEERQANGDDPLVVEVVPFVLGLDGLPVNGTRVSNGEIDPDGVEPKRVHLAVGSANPVKIEAAKTAFGRWVPDVETTGVEVETGVPEQPHDAEGPQGAANRAIAALEAVDDAGLGIGIEAALHTQDPSGEPFDVQYCAIADRQGRITVGAGPGFTYPPVVLEALEAGETVGDVIGRLAGSQSIGREEGAIGYLTRLGTTREELTEWAVISAVVPRLRPELYDPLPLE